jgi:serine/threonine-protein kinase
VGLQAAGDAAWRRHEVDLAEAAALRGRVGQLEEIHPRWQPVAEKRELVEARARLAELEASSWRAFLEGVNRYTDALVHVPDHAAVRRALADRFWERFRDAEERRAPLLAETYRMLVERFHDGRLGRELEGRGRLELSVVPAEAELVMHPLLERDLVLVDGPGRPLGRGDAVVEDLPMGRYVIVAAAPGCAAARYPVHVRRCEHWRGRLRLLREGALPDGWAYVPATQAWLGGDPSVSACHPRHLVSLPSFAIRRHAVTLGEYCAFLDGVGADAANAELVPEAVGIGPVCGLDATGRWRPFASERAAAAYAPVPPADRERVPAYGVTRGAAEAFARWEGERLGRRVRLPTADEWELAARGVDERAYPWGDALDMALCAVRESFSGPAYAPPVESVATDCSVYGVRDMAGTIQEFTSSWSDEARGLVEVRGGGWSSGPQSTRCAWRASFNTSGRSVSLGFRLVLELDEADLAEPAGGGA